MIEADIVEVTELPADLAATVVDLDHYVSKYGEARAFYLGIDYDVCREDKYHFDGVNRRSP